ncbi:hypothetical protein L2D00_06995 [Hyphomonadaceae bacterium BL14]|nr:hypothetical protein L2D00_06995 [Hyphomonadaceae bacterium BL14]
MPLSKLCYGAAAALSLLGAAAHELAGAPLVLEPLARSGLPPEVIWLHHFSWHVGTIAVLAMAAMFVAAIWHPAATLLAGIASAMSAGFAALGVSLAVFGDSVLWTTPAPYPWTLVALLGAAGVMLARPRRQI